MTICIGALAQISAPLSPCIVLCFDTKVATNEFGSDSEYKHHSLSPGFMALAADRPARAKELADLLEVGLTEPPVTARDILDRLRASVVQFKQRLAGAYVGRRLGVPYQDFLDHGRTWFGDSAVEKYRIDIEANPLGVEMIIAGFIGREPLLFELRDGEISPVTNFSIIGTGAYTAEPALHAREQTKHTPLERSLYNCYEAKRIAETSPFVGKTTRMLVLRPPTEQTRNHLQLEIVTSGGLKFLQKLFNRHGPRPLKLTPMVPEGSLARVFFNVTEGRSADLLPLGRGRVLQVHEREAG